MLKCHIDKAKKRVWVKANGTPNILMVEVGTLIWAVFHYINKQAPDAAKQFKNELLGMLLDPESPVWKDGA